MIRFYLTMVLMFASSIGFAAESMTAPEAAAAEPSSESFFYEFLRMMAMLGLLLGIMLVVSWFLKRMLNTRMEQINNSSPIKVLSRRNLSPKTVIYVVDIYGKKSIVAESANGVSYLGDLSETHPSKPFETYLKDSP